MSMSSFSRNLNCYRLNDIVQVKLRGFCVSKADDRQKVKSR